MNWYETLPDDLWLKPDGEGVEEAEFIRRVLRLRKGSAVLDAPCGAGRIAIHLAHAGCVVTGTDLRRSFTKRAAARFRNERRRGRFITMDLRDMEFAGEFDGICSWLGSFGYFDEAGNLDVMARYARALRKGGRLLVDQVNRENVLRHFRPLVESGSLRVEHRWDPKGERVVSVYVSKAKSRKRLGTSSMRLYTPGQTRRLFEQVGLVVEDVYGSFAGGPYRRSSRRLIVVGRRPR